MQFSLSRIRGWSVGLCILLILVATTFSFASSRAVLAAGEQQIADLGQCQLASGATLENCNVGYRLFGELNDERSNAIIILTWFTGTVEDYVNFGYIGPGRFADSSRYFVIAIDALGNGVSSSPTNSLAQAGSGFPDITIGDMVDSQYRLLTEVLGIEHLHAVIGISMGGMQTFEWVVRYPDFADNAVPVIGTPRQTSYDILLWETQLATIEHLADVDYDGAVRVIAGLDALTRHTPGYVATVTTPDGYAEYMTQLLQLTVAFRLENRVPQLQAMIAHDITDSFDGSMSLAATAAEARMLVIVSPTDHMVNPLPSREFVSLSDAELHELQGDCGHLSVACEKDTLAQVVNDFLLSQ